MSIRWILTLAALVLAAACTVPKAPTSTTTSSPRPPATTTTVPPTTTTTTVRVSDERHVFGDSLTAQVIAGGHTAGDYITWHAQPGWTLEQWAPEVIAAARTVPREIVLALGSAEALDGVWSSDEQAVWTWVVASVHPETELMIVTPYFNATAHLQWPGSPVASDDATRWMVGTLWFAQVDCFAMWGERVARYALFLVDGVHAGDAAAVQERYALTTAGCAGIDMIRP